MQTPVSDRIKIKRLLNVSNMLLASCHYDFIASVGKVLAVEAMKLLLMQNDNRNLGYRHAMFGIWGIFFKMRRKSFINVS